MRISVVVTTYRKPEWLARVLHGYRLQDDHDFEVVVADDGSGRETAEVVEEVARSGSLELVHVWHEDRGFRKTEIVNRAIRASTGAYLLFTDGDCVPRRDLVAVHRREARPGYFLSGGYVKLPARASEAVDDEAIAGGNAFRASWLRARGAGLGRRRLRLLRPGWVPAVLDRITPTRPTFNGMNSSVWREAALEVNGFDLELAYGGLDRDFGQRLENLGFRGHQVRHRAVVLHLHHDRPWRDPERLRDQRRHLREVERAGTVRAPRGLDELDDEANAAGVRVRRWSGEGEVAAGGGR